MNLHRMFQRHRAKKTSHSHIKMHIHPGPCTHIPRLWIHSALTQRFPLGPGCVFAHLHLPMNVDTIDMSMHVVPHLSLGTCSHTCVGTLKTIQQSSVTRRHLGIAARGRLTSQALLPPRGHILHSHSFLVFPVCP